jgi:hypothetical protein
LGQLEHHRDWLRYASQAPFKFVTSACTFRRAAPNDPSKDQAPSQRLRPRAGAGRPTQMISLTLSLRPRPVSSVFGGLTRLRPAVPGSESARPGPLWGCTLAPLRPRGAGHAAVVRFDSDRPRVAGYKSCNPQILVVVFAASLSCFACLGVLLSGLCSSSPRAACWLATAHGLIGSSISVSRASMPEQTFPVIPVVLEAI